MKPEPIPNKEVLDFVSLPIGQTVAVLRGLGENLVQAVLDFDREPDLTRLLFDKMPALPGSPGLRTVNPIRRWLFFPKKLRNDPSMPMRGMWTGSMSETRWRARAGDVLSLALGGGRADYLPDAFWPYVGKAAWRDLTFQFSVAYRIHGYLKQQFLFHRDDMPLPTLSPQTLWVLIAVSGGVPRLPWFNAARRDHARAVDRIREVARDLANVGAWAGFWDQWLIQLARERWPGAFARQPQDFRTNLANLPYLKEFGVPDAKILRRRLPRPADLKRFLLDTLDNLKNVDKPAPKRDNDGEVLLSHPYWTRQIPPFFKTAFPELGQAVEVD